MKDPFVSPDADGFSFEGASKLVSHAIALVLSSPGAGTITPLPVLHYRRGTRCRFGWKFS